MGGTILALEELCDRLGAAERQLFEGLFEVRAATGRLAVPGALEDTVAGWYGAGPGGDVDRKTALERACAQPLLRTFNRWTYEGTLFNPLRDLRPSGAGADEVSIDEWVDEGRERCDFCRPVTRTTADVWGRIESDHCVTAANASKYDAHHGLVVFRDHHPLRLSRDRVRDYFEVAGRWWQRTREVAPYLRHASVAWNCLERSGASQRHGHLHVLASDHRPYGHHDRLLRAADEYGAQTGRDYWQDWVAAHGALGLVDRAGGVARVATITPFRGHEVVLVADRFDREVADAVSDTLVTLTTSLGALSFNAAVYLPPEPRRQGDRVIGRCVSRGDPRRLSNDVGAMEVFGTPIVASDPLRTVHALRRG